MSQIKPTLVIIPGFMGQPEDWTWLSLALESQVACLVVDIGQFDTGITANEADDDRFFSACDALFEHFKQVNDLPERCALLGYSMGGRIAMAWAQRFPDRFNHLILESCHPGLLSSVERVERQQSDNLWAERFHNKPITDVLSDWYQQGVFGNLNAEQRAQCVMQRQAQTPAKIAKQLMAFSLGWQPYLGHLPAIPTAYICGGLDNKYVAIGVQLSAQNDNLTLYQMSDCGHNVHQESPQAFLVCIKTLLV